MADDGSMAAAARQAIDAARLLGAKTAREAAEITAGRDLTEAEWDFFRPLWEQVWNEASPLLQ